MLQCRCISRCVRAIVPILVRLHRGSLSSRQYCRPPRTELESGLVEYVAQREAVMVRNLAAAQHQLFWNTAEEKGNKAMWEME